MGSHGQSRGEKLVKNMYTFASLTGKGIVVIPGGSVSTYKTQFFLLSRRGALLRPPRLTISAAAVHTGCRG